MIFKIWIFILYVIFISLNAEAQNEINITVDDIKTSKTELWVQVKIHNNSHDTLIFKGFMPVMHFLSQVYTEESINEVSNTTNLDRSGFIIKNSKNEDIDPVDFVPVTFHNYKTKYSFRKKYLKQCTLIIKPNSILVGDIKLKFNKIKLPKGQYKLRMFQYLAGSDLFIKSDWVEFLID